MVVNCSRQLSFLTEQWCLQSHPCKAASFHQADNTYLCILRLLTRERLLTQNQQDFSVLKILAQNAFYRDAQELF